MDWIPPPKPADWAEARLIEAILDGRFPIDSPLPAERELASMLGVTRPTLREALQRMARDGWLEIHQGRATRVRDYWKEGNLAVLGSIVHHAGHLPAEFVPNLLKVRMLLAPVYFRQAVENDPASVMRHLESLANLPDTPEAFAAADWELHHRMTVLSGNPVFTLILNGFCDFYQTMALIYFRRPASRLASRRFYIDLMDAIQQGDPAMVEEVTRRVMSRSLALWQAATEVIKQEDDDETVERLG